MDSNNSKLLDVTQEMITVSDDNWQDIFNQIVTRDTRAEAEKYSPVELRTLASFLIEEKSGKDKDLLYELSGQHPDASEVDRDLVLVKTYGAWGRNPKMQKGAQKALDMMLRMKPHNDEEFKTAWSTTVGECLLALGREGERRTVADDFFAEKPKEKKTATDAKPETITDENWERICNQIFEGDLRVEAEKYSPVELRRLVSFLAVSGRRQEKDLLYELSGQHPDASEVDRDLAVVNTFDAWRRDAETEEERQKALDMMLRMKRHEDTEFQIARCSAMSECFIVLERERDAIAVAKNAVEKSKGFEKKDKYLYRIIGYLWPVLLLVQKGEMSMKDMPEDFEEMVEIYKKGLTDATLGVKHKNYAERQFHNIVGYLHECKNEFSDALESFAKSFEMTPDNVAGEKCVWACNCLYCIYTYDLSHANQTTWEQFVRENHTKLQATYITGYQNKYDCVMGRLGLQKKEKK